MAFTQEQLQRYDRHFVLREIGVQGQKRLLDSRVLVIGAGGLGSAVLLYLAAAGVGSIGIVDDDTVDLSNLQRQIIHNSGRSGVPKAQSAKETITALNPDVEVYVYQERATVDNILELIAPYDLVIDATDRFESKFLINDACVLAKKPYIHAGVVHFEGQILTYVPGHGPCLRCLLEKVPSAEETLTCAQVGVLGAVVGVIGSLQAAEAVKYLTGAGKLLTGRMLRVDALTMETQVLRAPHTSPDCPVCKATSETNGEVSGSCDLRDKAGKGAGASCGTASTWLQDNRDEYQIDDSLTGERIAGSGQTEQEIQERD